MSTDDTNKSYEEKLKYIKEAYGYDEQQMKEYEEDIKDRAWIGGYLEPDVVLSLDYHDACNYVEENDKKRIAEQKEKEKRLKLEKKEQLEKAKMIKKYGKAYNSGVCFTDKVDNFILWMRENKRKCKVWSKLFARDETVRSAAKTVVNNPGIAMSLGGLITMCVARETITAMTAAMMFGAGAGHLYAKFKNMDKEENNKSDEKSQLDKGSKNAVLDEKNEKKVLDILSKMKNDQKGG